MLPRRLPLTHLHPLLTAAAFPFCDPRSKISQAEYWQRVSEAPISYSGPGWRDVSPRAVDLVRRMLERDCSRRIAAQEALHDSWLQDLSSSRAAAACWRVAPADAVSVGFPSLQRLYGNVLPGGMPTAALHPAAA